MIYSLIFYYMYKKSLENCYFFRKAVIVSNFLFRNTASSWRWERKLQRNASIRTKL